MKETVLDVLMYLFESFVESDDEPEPDRNELREELEQAGFGDREIDRALDWLDGLNSSTDVVASGNATGTQNSTAIRIFDAIELERFDAVARGYLLHLEQLRILPPPQRELVIDRLLALDSGEIDIEQIKWVVMMVLFSQPGHEQAYAQMEDLVFAEEPHWLH
jgi:Smg protein